MQVTAFVSRMCAALWCPHLRQAHVVLIHRTQTDSFTLSASLSLPKTSLASLHLSHKSRLWSHFCLFDSSLPFFSQHIFLISLANIFFALCPIFAGLSLFFPQFVPPEHISYFSTCHPFYCRIFETCSYRSIATVSLQDVALTSYIPPL